MVQITHARIKKGEEWETISAREHDRQKKELGKTDCHCPDENCPAKLTHYREHEHTYYDEETGKAFTLKIAPHYKRHVGSPEHSPVCTAIKHYHSYQAYARDLGGLSVYEGAFVFNLNIMTDTLPAPLRQNRERLRVPFHRSVSHSNLESREPRKLSEGLSETSALARLIDRTEFHPEHRNNIIMRRHGHALRLSEMFYDNAEKLFIAELDNAREGKGRHPVAIEFKPIPIGKFHSPRNWTIQGQAVPMMSDDGKKYYASMMLHCAGESMFYEMQKLIKGKKGVRSFMVFSDHVYVDRIETGQKIMDINAGRAKDSALYVHIHVSRPEQLHIWNRNTKQLSIDIQMDTMVRPPKEIPPELTRH